MELSGTTTAQEGEIPMPLNTAYNVSGAHGNMNHHDHPAILAQNHIIPSSTTVPSSQIQISINGLINSNHEDTISYKQRSSSSSPSVVIKYRECLKNHAASMGGNATDGCGEFMPSGEEGSLEALNCSACHCHRNFHRKEIEGEQQQLSAYNCTDLYYHNTAIPHLNRVGRKVILGHHHKNALGPEGNYPLPSRSVVPHHQMIVPYSNLGSMPSESDEQEDQHHHNIHNGGGGYLVTRPASHHHLGKKRFRTKFTPEQKEKMLNFAEKAGWRIQKQEESVVQQICQEIGVKRRVLKVWMHNNKHNLAKKNMMIPSMETTATAAAPPELTNPHQQAAAGV